MLERWRRRTPTRAAKVLLPSMVLLAGCPQQCDPAPPADAPAAAPAAAPAFVAQAGAVFVEDFASSGGFYDRFDFGLSLHKSEDTALQSHLMKTWQGDHNMACSGPDQLRDVTIHPGLGLVTPEQVASQTGKSQLFWWCAPGGDAAKGHLMTATNGEGYQIAFFSPKQVFTNVSRVCW